ncbi:MAG: glycogen synthase [Brevinematia bacterium]
MEKNLKLLFVASEAVPFAKVGGLADVVGALTKSIKRLLPDSDVRLFIPFYKTVKEYFTDSSPGLKLTTNQEIKIADRTIPFEVFEVTNDDVTCYFINQPSYFNRDGIYTDINTNLDYPDSLERFTFFSKAVLETCIKINFKPHIIQVNDWQTSLIPVYLKTNKNYGFFKETKSVLLIHNLSYQGIFSIDQFNITGIDWKYYNKDGLEFYGHLNLLKGGIVFSDCILTVSETYAKEIQTVEYGNGLEDILHQKNLENKLFGIVNGVDYDEWDPSKDVYLKNRFSINYDIDSLENKKKIKEIFLKDYGIKDPDISKPLISIISRLVDQKGFDIIFQVIEEIVNLDSYFVVLGKGKKEYETKLKEIEKRFWGKVLSFTEFNIPLSHYIEAASDIFILPSRFEPCGLNQLYSLRYGTIPVARRTGGLADTLKDGENAFLFDRYSPEDFLQALKKATDIYRNQPEAWENMVVAGMKERWNWERSARKYIEVYEKILAPTNN